MRYGKVLFMHLAYFCFTIICLIVYLNKLTVSRYILVWIVQFFLFLENLILTYIYSLWNRPFSTYMNAYYCAALIFELVDDIFFRSNLNGLIEYHSYLVQTLVLLIYSSAPLETIIVRFHQNNFFEEWSLKRIILNMILPIICILLIIYAGFAVWIIRFTTSKYFDLTISIIVIMYGISVQYFYIFIERNIISMVTLFFIIDRILVYCFYILFSYYHYNVQYAMYLAKLTSYILVTTSHFPRFFSRD